MSRPGKTSSRCLENSVSMDITSSKWPCLGQSLTIRILPSRSIICALISPTFSFIKTSCGKCPSRICCRISGTHLGQRESVVRGQPSGGLVFSYDLSSGFSDHLGVGEGLGLTLFRPSNTTHAPLAAGTTAFSTYLIGLRMITFRSWLLAFGGIPPGSDRIVLSHRLLKAVAFASDEPGSNHPKTAAPQDFYSVLRPSVKHFSW